MRRRESAAAAQLGAQCQHHVEDHAHAREMLARKAAAVLVRVDDASGFGKPGAGQVMVGHQHAHAEPVRLGDAVHRRDAVVDRDEEPRRALRRLADDLRREAVAVLEAIRHEVIDAGPHRAQRPHPHCARRRAVGVVVAHDEDALLARDRVGEEPRGVVDVMQPIGCRERLQGRGELVDARHAARREEAREARIAARRGEARAGGIVDGAHRDLRHAPPMACARGTSATSRRA